MAYSISPFTEPDIEAVKSFNARLSRGGVSYSFPETPISEWLPQEEGVSIHQEYYLVKDNDAVRGAYILKPQEFLLNGKKAIVADYQLPISEGLIDSTHGMVGLLTIKDALRRRPLLFGLGIGSYEEAVAKLLGIMRFQTVSCPFYFYVSSPFSFLRNIQILRRKVAWRTVLDLSAFTGLGPLGIRLRNAACRNQIDGIEGSSATVVSEFDEWCNEIWNRACADYALIAVRNLNVLRILYPKEKERFIRLRVDEDGQIVGWAVLLNTAMRGHRQFGDMTVGSVVDVLAIPGKESLVIWHAKRALQQRGADILVSNQLHESWGRAFTNNGFLIGPSNFIFAASPKLAAQLGSLDVVAHRIHMTRGDGDGPINL